MRQHWLGPVIARVYPRLPFRERILRFITRLEGGQMFSITLRRLLEDHYRIRVGAFSYGALLWPGSTDPDTTIGAYVSIGPGVRRFGASHPIEEPCLHPLWYNPRLGLVDESRDVVRTSCTINNGAWIGAGAVILPGCKSIGVGAVIGAGSVVTRNVPDFTIVVGNPARPIGTRLNPDLQSTLLSAGHWSLDPREALDEINNLRVQE